MTPERARAAGKALDAALWFQNERYYQHLRSRMPWRPRLRAVALVLSAVGFALAAASAALSLAQRPLFAAMMVAFALFFCIFLSAESLERAIRRGTRRLVAWRARRTMAPVVRRAPYTIEYGLEGSRLSIRASPLGIDAVVPLERVRVAIVAPSLICVFDRPFGQRPRRVIYYPGEEALRALREPLAAAQAEILTLA